MTDQLAVITWNPKRLGDMSPGLFLYGETLALLTEYGGDCYIVESGEMFWAGCNGDKSKLAALIVVPVSIVKVPAR